MMNKFCRCEKSSRVYTESNDFAHWDVCSDCGNPIEDTYEYLNHYDGEDHDFNY